MSKSSSIETLVSRMKIVVEERLAHNPQPNAALARLLTDLQEWQVNPNRANMILVISGSWLVTKNTNEEDQEWVNQMFGFCCALAENAGLINHERYTRSQNTRA